MAGVGTFIRGVLAMAFFDNHFRCLLITHTIVVCILFGIVFVTMR
jgi:hypothetical protein